MTELTRRDFIGAAASLAAATALPTKVAAESTKTAAAPLEEWSIAEVSSAMQRGETTAHALTQQYLERIAAMDRRGPNLRYVLETNPDALAIADALDIERKSGRLRGPLHGIPVLIKDNIDSADRMTTTAGSLALEGNVASRDAHVVEQLRAAGAIILGKTNLSEWANFRSTHSSSGWSARGDWSVEVASFRLHTRRTPPGP